MSESRQRHMADDVLFTWAPVADSYFQVSSPREAAEFLAAELQRQGYPVDAATVAHFEREIAEQLQRHRVADRVNTFIDEQLAGPLQDLNRGVSRLCRHSFQSLKHG